MSEIDFRLLPDFIVEASEHLEEMESLLLKLIEDTSDLSILNEIFRPAHTIKGSAQYIGIARISKLAHKLEDMLDLLRSGGMVATQEIVETLIASKDRINTLVKELEASKQEQSSIDDLIERIGVHLGEKPATTQPSQTTKEVAPVKTQEAGFQNSKTQDSKDETEDKELYDIFINHLLKQAESLRVALAGIDKAQDKLQRIDQCVDILEKLATSANYMGYLDLLEFYKGWLDVISQSKHEMSKGKDVPLAFMDFYFSELKQLYPQIKGSIDNKAPVKADDLKTVEYAESSESSEETDVELYEIFVKQLKREYSAINSSIMMCGDDLAEKCGALYKCGQSLEKLRSSANYMNYSDAVEFYRDWEGSLKDAIKSIENGKDVSLAFMDFYLAELKQHFPVLNQLSEVDSVSNEPAISAQKVLESVKSKQQTIAQVKESPESSDLFNKLSSALNVSMRQVGRDEIKTLHDVYEELVAPKKVVPEIPKDIPERRASGKDRRVRDDRRYMEERRINQESKDKKTKRSVRVDSEKIDALMNQVGELVVDRSYFVQLLNELGELQQYFKESLNLEPKELKMLRTFNYRLAEAISGMGRTSNELQEGVMKMRMLPISQIFNRYPRLIHDLTNNTDKKVNLVINGEDTELDKMIVEELSDPLVHIIRNAVDHGIETREERKSKGKDETATLRLVAYQESNNIVIEVTDDGRGIDNNKIKTKAIEKGLYTSEELESMSPREITQIIMMAGFSTADKITATSGRGVGMDVVRKNVEKLNGHLEIESKFGMGTQMRLKIPLTLAIIHALMIRIGEDIFAVPLANVDETVRINTKDISYIEGVEVISLRDQTLPIFRLSKLFGIKSDVNPDKLFVVIVSSGGQRTGFVVDELLGQNEVVIKPLVEYVQEKSGFSGATIIGDGRISLILDVYELVRITARRQAKKHQEQAKLLKSKVRVKRNIDTHVDNN